MNRGQIKRIRKETERLRKAGKDWDALAKLAREGALEEFRVEWGEIWQDLARHALRTTAKLEEFLAKIGEFDAVPDTGDLRFLRCVADYLDAKDVAPALAGMTGLSAPAETLRRELLKRGNEQPAPDAKLRKLLERFAAAPEKALPKDYRRLKELLAPYPGISQQACDALEESLTLARRQNGASAVKNGPQGVSAADSTRIDALVESGCTGMPGPLFRVVAAPALAQVCAAVSRIAALNPEQAAHLALCAPFCMECLAGPRWDDLRKKFQLGSAHKLTPQDRKELRKTVQTATFEERLSLIGRLSQLLSHQGNFDADLHDTVVLLYKGVFAELAKRRPKLPEREQRRVAAVFGPVLDRHLRFLRGDDEDFPFLLDSAAAAGCLSAESALQHAFFAVISRDRAMISNARGMLKLIPKIKDKDVQELFDAHQSLIVEDVKGLKGLLELCRECGHELDALAANRFIVSIFSLLIMNTFAGSSRGRSFLDDILGSSLSEELKRSFQKLFKGMDCLADNPAFLGPTQVARAFPSGKLSGLAYRQFLENRVAAEGDVEQAIRYSVLIVELVESLNETESPFSCFGTHPLVKEIFLAALEVLCAKMERIALIPTKDLAFFLENLLEYCDGKGMDRYLMLITNACAERGQAGDKEAIRLGKLAIEVITRNNKPKRGRRR